MRIRLGAVALAAVLAVCGCSAAAATASSSPTARTAATSAPALPPDCASALAALPASAPATEQEAAAAFAALGGHKGTMADQLADDVAADSESLSFDLAENYPVTAELGRWKADAAALRSYC